ncbi:MAG: hypothetical protein HOM52_16585 [Rhodospirillaceae bacterium]|nr:hypothetical protein [Rhodospirillaceae bacterium]MBT5040122.1 hypothetical protein [Rhodospirillaceae bacterium]MBT5675669.1 hypothetical protein [Rhodospirillaceae bacterium]MBT5779715.1 hypothetical protein [Rhodospirillaceae bacterium]MBT7294167.1 hypothetical protein [Rhodospirillaceae bacterium]
MSSGFLSDSRQAGEVLSRLAAEDVACLPLLPEPELAPLLDAARGLSYRTARGEVGAGARAVRQDFDICMAPPRPGPLWGLVARVEKFLGKAFAENRPALLDGPLILNDLVVQHYQAGSSGITAHRDHVRYTGLVALILLSGEGGRFFACTERSGEGAREIIWRPGNLLLMRAPGFAGRNDRPFHYLSDVTTERYSIGLRHDTQA